MAPNRRWARTRACTVLAILTTATAGLVALGGAPARAVGTAPVSVQLSSSVNPAVYGQSVSLSAVVTAVPPTTGTPTGTVTFFNGATAMGTRSISAGAAVYTTTYSVGVKSFTATYNGNTTFAVGTSAVVSQTINPTPTTTTVTSNATPGTLGAPITFTATTTATAPGSGAPSSGTLKFYDGAVLLGSKTPATGVASLTTSSLTLGNHSVTAVFSGSTSYTGSASAAITQTVAPALTTTVVTTAPNPSTFGATVTLTATVTSVAGTPTGSITFTDGATPLATVTLTAGQATATVGAWTVGAHPLTATYSGAASFQPSTSATFTQQVDRAPSTVALASDPNPSVNGDAVTLTATVTSASGSPSGSVTFTDGPTQLGTATLVGNTATLLTSALAGGTHTLTASYAGDADFAPSTSAALDHAVDPAATATALVSGTNPSSYADPVTFVATVTSGAGTPSGTVLLLDDTTVVASGALEGGQASITLSDLAVGSHSLTAAYVATAGFDASTSAPVVQAVAPAPTSVALSSGTNPASAGDAITLTATVSATNGIPTGAVTFADGTTNLGSSPLVSGSAALTVSSLTGGDHALTAAYAGDGSFGSSTSAVLTQHVNAPSTTSLVADADPSAFGGPVTFTATVTVGGTPTGTVTFHDGAVVLGSTTLTSSSAAITVTDLAAGTHSVTATYSGDATWGASTSAAVSHTVLAAPTTTSLASDANPVVADQTITLTATVSGGAGVPTGNITFADGTTTLGTAALAGGVAALPGVSLAVGTHSLTADYAGAGSSGPSVSAPLVVVVIPTTTTSVAADLNPATFGQSVTFTATVAGGSGTPTGSVEFSDGATVLGSAPVNTGTAVLTVAGLTAGTHPITARYSGDADFGPSTSTALTETVTAAATAATLVATPAKIASGQPITLTATVMSSGGIPPGSVSFLDGATSLGSAPLGGGQATLTVSTLSVGTHALTASYPGAADFAPSTSSAVTETVVAPVLFVDKANPACKNSGTGAGSAATPYCAINSAAAKVAAGQTVEVAAGSYTEKVSIPASGTAGSPITFTPALGATVTVTGSGNGFTMTNRSWVTIRGFQVTQTTGPGISVTNSSNVTIDGNHVSFAGQPVSGDTAVGIKLNGTNGSTVVNNVLDHNTDFGIYLTTGADANVVAHNEAYANARGYTRAAAGIAVATSTGNVVYDNVSHDNEDSGINVWTGRAEGSNLVFDNVAYNNGDHGIDVHNAVSAQIISNTTYGNYDSGIEMTTSIGSLLANNVSVDNGINSARTSGNIRVDSVSVPTTTLNDDLVFLRVPGVMVDWGGVKYPSLAAFRTATGQESRGIEADPLFVSILTANFRLLAGSPAIDSANSGAPGQPALDFDGHARVDDPATVDTGIGPITFADRGAFEYGS